MTTTRTQTTGLPTQGRTLADLDDTERYRRFDELQTTMPQVWRNMRQDLDDECVVVVPSVSLARSTASSGALVQAMEAVSYTHLTLPIAA